MIHFKIIITKKSNKKMLRDLKFKFIWEVF
jgi:hypothetical protein